MADELIIQAGWRFAKGNQAFRNDLITYYQTVSGTRPLLQTVNVGTSEEDFAVGDVGTPGLLWLRNLDTTNFVTWGPKATGAMVLMGKLLPTADSNHQSPPTILYVATAVTLRWIADTAACDVEAVLFPL